MEEENNAPTEKQLAAIRRMASVAKLNIDVNSIKSRREASQIIENLIQKRNGGSVAVRNGSQDKRCVAYGLSTKVVFYRYLKIGRNPQSSEQYWKDVDDFYRQYLEHQRRAMKPGPSG